MPRLSIVIAVSGTPQQLDDTLVSVLENRPTDCEILVVHDQPYHDPYNLSDEVRFVRVERGHGIVACLNRGLAASQSPVIHVLACGVEVCSGWADAALPHFDDPDIGSVSAVVLDRQDRQKVLSVGYAYHAEGSPWRPGQGNAPDDILSCRQDLCGPDILAAFYRKSGLEEVGGFSSSATDALAGVDLALALQHAGYRCALEPRCVAHVDRAALHDKGAFHRGRATERLFWRWASSYGWFSPLTTHLAFLIGQSVISLWRPSTTVELAGRACGAVQCLFTKRRRDPRKHVAIETSSPIAAPHFAIIRSSDEQIPSRVA